MENPEQTHLLSSSSITGTTVKNLKDDDIGSIKDIMLYTDTGEVAYAVLSVNSGFLNMGSKYFAIPWEAFSFVRAARSGEKVVTLDVDKEKLENSPGFDKDNWPMTAQEEVISSAYKYYGVQMRGQRRNSDSIGDNRMSNQRMDENRGGDQSMGSDRRSNERMGEDRMSDDRVTDKGVGNHGVGGGGQLH